MFNILQNKGKLVILLFIIVFLILLNIFLFHSFLIGVFFGSFFILISSLIIGTNYFNHKNIFINTCLGLLLVFGIIILSTCLIYIISSFNYFNLIFTIIAIAMVDGCLLIKNKYLLANRIATDITQIHNDFSFKKEKNHVYLLLILFIFFMQFCVYTVFNAQSSAPLKSPWEVIPTYFFIIYALTFLCLFGLVIYAKNRIFPAIGIFALFLLTNILVVVIYQLGFDYDPIIHLVNIKQIFNVGIITPKSITYLGLYNLIVFLAKLFQLPIAALEKFIAYFMPVLGSLSLPVIYYYFFHDQLFNKKNYHFIGLFVFLVPLGSFIVTVPGSLGLLINILIIFLIYSLFHEQKSLGKFFLLIFFLSLVSFCIHPSNGIFSAIVLILAITYYFLNKLKGFAKVLLKIIIVLFSLILSAVYPLSYYINSLGKSTLKVAIDINKTISFAPLLNKYANILPHSNNYSGIYHIVYLFTQNFSFILLATFIFFLIYSIRQKKNYQLIFFTLNIFIVLQINYLLVNNYLNFDLIDYEKEDYANRIFNDSFFIFWPFFIYIFSILVAKLLAFSKYKKMLMLIVLTILASINLYTHYRAYDPYNIPGGRGVSLAGLEAVHYIYNDAQANNIDNYIVLSDQMVAVLALKEYGYYKQYNGLYYYSIPTSSPLYNYFLNIIEKNKPHQAIIDAANLAKVKTVYFTLIDYWDDYDEITAKIKKSCTSFQTLQVDDQRVFIAKFNLN